jgi:OFA family oxalate/formate antiporter-like MFS transporter
MQQNTNQNASWKVLIAGTCITLTLGVLYSWSVIKKALVHDWGWSNSDASLPYTVAILVFALALLVAGRLQDKIGPRKIVALGGFLTGLGLIMSSLVHSVPLLVLTFGVISGTGIGFGYASVTPPVLKWFHPSQKGMVTGIVVSGFGLASIYIAPLTTWLLGAYGISMAFAILGTLIIIISFPLSQMVVNPPDGYIPAEPKGLSKKKGNAVKVTAARDYDWKEMVKTKQFYFLWIMFVLASSAGLMIIGNIASIAKTQANWDKGFYLVSLLAFFNATGRVGGGVVSDKIGRVQTMMVVFLLQGVNMVLFSTYTTPVMMVIGTILAGIGYGSLLSVFPSTVADYYGLKNFGANYGVVYTAWGISGVVGPIIAGAVVDTTGTYNLAYTISAALLVVAVALAFLTKPVDASK